MSLQSRLLIASAVFAALVVVVFGALVITVLSLRDSTRREARAQERVSATLMLEKLVLDLETGVRGFVLTRQKRMLVPWRRARRELPASLADFERAFADTRAEPRARDLAEIIRQYQTDYADLVVGLARYSPEAAGAPAAIREGNYRISLISDRFASLLAAEARATEAEEESAAAKSRRAIVITVVGLSATGVLIVLFGVFLARSVARPIRAAADGAERIATGQLDTRVEEKGPGEVGELIRAFNEMAAQLERNRIELETQNAQLRESERMKAQLISIVSHELRTPLTSILGFTTLLLQRDFDEHERRRYLAIIDEQSQRLSTLLNDFLDAQRVEEGRLELEFDHIDLAGLLREQAALFEGQSDRHEIRLSVPPSLPIRGDANRLAQVVSNLLSNAIKYSPEGGVVEVSGRRDDGVVHIDVRDEGVGIPRSEQSSIFTKFFRGEAHDEAGIGGTGLGLALAREIVEAHSGRIGFTSEPGAGSTFWVELPADTDVSSSTNEGKGAP